MVIQVGCNFCMQRFAVRETFSGKRIKCPKCSGVIQVPGASAVQRSQPVPQAKPQADPSKADTPARPRPAARKRAAQAPRSDTTQRVRKRSTQDSVRIPPSTAKASSSSCPECGALMPPQADRCPDCSYHVKLKRKLSLRKAINSATHHKDGYAADGKSRRITRSDQANARNEKGRKLYVRLVLCLFLVALAYVAYLLVSILSVGRTPTMEEVLAQGEQQRWMRALNRDPTSWSPLWVGESVVFRVTPSDFLPRSVENSDAENPAALARQAELPYYKHESLRFYGGVAKRLEIESQKEELAPTLRSASKKGKGEIWIFRAATSPAKDGYLTGAVVEFGSQESAFRTALEQAQQKRAILIRKQRAANESAYESWVISERMRIQRMMQEFGDDGEVPEDKLSWEAFEASPAAPEEQRLPPEPTIYIKGRLSFLLTPRNALEASKPYDAALLNYQESLSGKVKPNPEQRAAPRETEVYPHLVIKVTHFAVTEKGAPVLVALIVPAGFLARLFIL